MLLEPLADGRNARTNLDQLNMIWKGSTSADTGAGPHEIFRTMTQSRKLRLGAFIQATGHHIASWRHPAAQADAGLNIAHYRELAQTAERGKFDLVFVADSPGA